MDDMELIKQGFLLMVVGLAVVLTFLSLVIVWIKFSSAVIQRILKNYTSISGAEAAVVEGRSASSEGAAVNDSELTAVLSAAVRKYREDKWQ